MSERKDAFHSKSIWRSVLQYSRFDENPVVMLNENLGVCTEHIQTYRHLTKTASSLDYSIFVQFS